MHLYNLYADQLSLTSVKKFALMTSICIQGHSKKFEPISKKHFGRGLGITQLCTQNCTRAYSFTKPKHH